MCDARPTYSIQPRNRCIQACIKFSSWNKKVCITPGFFLPLTWTLWIAHFCNCSIPVLISNGPKSLYSTDVIKFRGLFGFLFYGHTTPWHISTYQQLHTHTKKNIGHVLTYLAAIHILMCVATFVCHTTVLMLTSCFSDCCHRIELHTHSHPVHLHK